MSIPKRENVTERQIQAAAQDVLDAAFEYWTLMQKAGCGGALFWIDDEQGHTFVFTRGEYRDTLFRNIDGYMAGEPKRYTHLRRGEDETAEPIQLGQPIDISSQAGAGTGQENA